MLLALVIYGFIALSPRLTLWPLWFFLAALAVYARRSSTFSPASSSSPASTPS